MKNSDGKVIASSLLRFPSELLLHILSFLSIEDVLTLRQTCVALGHITRTSSLWLAFYKEQERILLLPVKQRPAHIPGIPPLSTEPEVITAYRIAKLWSRSRTSPPIQLRSLTSEPLLEMKFLSDRWLLCIYSNSLVNIWDISSPVPTLSVSVALPCLLPNMISVPLADTVAALDPTGTCLIIALNYAPGPVVTKIYRISLPSSQAVVDNQIQLLHTLLSSPIRSTSSIEPALNRLLLSGVVELDIIDVNYLDLSKPADVVGETANVTQRISPQSHGLDELTNNIFSSRIMGPFVMLFKSRSIELYLLKTDIEISSEVPSSRYTDCIQEFQFPHITIRSYSISDPIVQRDCLSFSFLGSDFLQGMFLFDVSIRYTPASLTDASLHVDCVGAYALAEDINLAALLPCPPLKRSRSINSSLLSLARTSAASQSQQPDQSSRAHELPSPTPRHPGIFGPPNNSSSGPGIPRGFISAMEIGPQGKRAVWIERKRGSTIREVLVWSRRGLDDHSWQDSSESSGSGIDSSHSAFDIPQNVVYRVNSYDLREDLMHCAIAEISGVIALANRMGEVFVLRPNM